LKCFIRADKPLSAFSERELTMSSQPGGMLVDGIHQTHPLHVHPSNHLTSIIIHGA